MIHILSINSHTWASLQNQNLLNEEEASSPWRGPQCAIKFILLILASAFPKGNFNPLWGRSSQILQGPLNTGSEVTLIPRDSKCHWGPLFRKGAYEGQVINGILTQVHPREGFIGAWTHRWLFPFSRMHKCNRYTQQQLNPHVGSLNNGRKAIIVGKSKWKPPEPHLSRNVVNQMINHISGENANISATIIDLKDAGVVTPTTPSFKSPISLV